MNDYRITFTRENGTIGTDTFTAPNEREARRDFAQVYRHGNGSITSVELIREDTPATKDQERKALEKIRQIIAGLGPQSYIATALEGITRPGGYEGRRELLKEIVRVALEHGLTPTVDRIEDYGQHFYFVRHCDKRWEPGAEGVSV